MEIADKALLLLIDLQKAIDDPSWGERNNPEAEKQIAMLLEFWRVNKMPLLHVRHMSTNPNSTYWPGQPGNEFKSECAPLPGEPVLEKSTNSAFVGTNLEKDLRGRGLNELVLVGVITNNSVEATARMAGNLGFRTIVASDGTFTFGRNDFNGKWHSAEDVHALSLANLQGEYAEVFTVRQILNLFLLN
jgi:nicotinamidase-related amidase